MCVCAAVNRQASSKLHSLSIYSSGLRGRTNVVMRLKPASFIVLPDVGARDTTPA
jgi:hypothetical protein